MLKVLTKLCFHVRIVPPVHECVFKCVFKLLIVQVVVACRQILTCTSASLGLPPLPWLSIRAAEIKDLFACERAEWLQREGEAERG